MDIRNYIKFKVKPNAKNPDCPWRTKENWSKKLVAGDTYNVGILTGEVNNITGIDLDTYKWNDDHPFYLEFGDDIRIFDTLTQKTPSGGYHLIFKYDKDIPTTRDAKYHIDIRNEGGYLVGAGSRVEGKTYKVFNDRPVKPLPPKLKEWLLSNNIYSKKQIASKRKQNKDCEKLFNDEDTNIYHYDIKNIEKVKELISLVPIFNQLDDNGNWLKFTTAIKQMATGYKSSELKQLVKLWNDHSRKFDGYDAINNKRIMREIKICYNTRVLEDCLTWGEGKDDNCKWILGYLKYKPIPPDQTIPTVVIDKPDQKHLGDILKDDTNYAIKSPPGTGKTTTFKQYIDTQPFLSIVSRVSLGREQYRIFNDAGVRCHFYQFNVPRGCLNTRNGGGCESVVCQIDSVSKKLVGADFSKYVVFLDEFNSMVEYLMDSDSLKDRTTIFQYFVRMIQTCRQVICVDADLSDICFDLLKFCGKINKDFVYIENKRKHYSNVAANEVFDEEEFIAEVETAMKDGHKTLICCDSKTQVKALSLKLPDHTAVHSDTIEDHTFQIDNHNHLIISPKIIYGLDGQIPRRVFCMYKENTILPKAMIQQASRARNIINLTYYFNKKNYIAPTFSNIGEVDQYLNIEEEAAREKFEFCCSPQLNQLYLKMVRKIRYNQDCYKSNIHLHFVRLLEERGFDIGGSIQKTKKINEKSTKKKVVENDLDNFDPHSEAVKMKNHLLQMNEEQRIKYALLFVDDTLLIQHFNICEGYFGDDKSTRLIQKNKSEFGINKITDTSSKILHLKKVMKDTNYTVGEDGSMECLNGYNADDAIDVYKIYRLTFSNRNKVVDLTNTDLCLQQINKMMTHLYGKKLTIRTRDTKMDKVLKRKLYRYSFNQEEIDYHKEIYKIRNSSFENDVKDVDTNVDIDDFDC